MPPVVDILRHFCYYILAARRLAVNVDGYPASPPRFAGGRQVMAMVKRVFRFAIAFLGVLALLIYLAPKAM